MEITSRVVAFADPNPKSPTRYIALPQMVRLSDGRLMIGCRTGSAKDTADGRVHLLESRDEGKSWQLLGYPFTIELNGFPCEQRIGLISEPEPGHLFCSLAVCERKDSSLPMCNPKTGGILPFHVFITDSTDWGRTWSKPRKVDVSPYLQPSLCGPVTKMPDGTWTIGFEMNKVWDDASKWFAKTCMIRSTDGGKTWREPFIVTHDATGRIFYWDARYTILRDETIFGSYWTFDNEANKDVLIHTITSRDSGKTWSKPHDTGVAGQITVTCELADGRLLMFYVHRHAPPSMRIRISEDRGKTWPAGSEFVVYSKTQDKKGEVTAGASADYFQDMQAWTFGWPNAVPLPNGDVLLAYYAGDGNCAAIHVTRLRL
jgi:hypothetical protein